MADPNATESRIVNQVAEATDDQTMADGYGEQQYQPTYKMVGESAIPVSKHEGSLWKSRRDLARKKLEKTGKKDNWDECLRYYRNDQLLGQDGARADNRRRRRLTNQETENIVYANTTSLIPSLYAKNPRCEVTPNIVDDNQEGGVDDDTRQLSLVGERLVNVLASMPSAPGFNYKPKARKLVINTALTNLAYVEVGYTKKDQSNEQAYADLQQISQELVNPPHDCGQQYIEECEGKLQALEETVDFLRPAGPWVKFRRPQDVLRDPDNVESDIEGCKWIMVCEYVATGYLNAKYREKVGDDQWRSIYKPTHVIDQASKGVDDQTNSFSLIDNDDDYRQYGFNDDYTYKRACRTKVWYVWDKIKRRVSMFNDKDWSWPIWVWDDPYRLDTFFPVFPLEFATDPEDDIANSEVTYYLDQQDAINENNSELKKCRNRLSGALFYNAEVVKDPATVDAWVKGEASKKAIPIKAPPDIDFNKAFFAPTPPSINYLQLFDNQRNYQVIDRLSSVSDVMRGEQFKVNTTNDAINTYNSQQQTRLDEKIDAVEDHTGMVFRAILHLCFQFMSQQEVGAVIGDADAKKWQNLEPADIRKRFSVRIVGGSTQKPTSKAKKEEAAKIGQVLGQFANAGGGVVVLLLLKIFERAYDDVVITDDDWKMVISSIMQANANSNPTGNPAASQAGAPQQGGAVPPEIAQQIQQLPPQAQQALLQAIQQGVPPQEALQQIMQMMQQQPQGQA
jgi:hypothetical protein